jgi:glycosyltransferase involved in cell wall biosynthesis
VLTLNEAAVLVRCLQSLAWADELVVVDSGSTDATRDSAAAHGARFYTNVQSGPFLIAEQRNWALEHAEITCTGVLFLDADEVVGQELAMKLPNVLSKETTYAAYELTPRYWYMGKWMRRTIGYPNWHSRVACVGSVRFAGGVWEHFASGIAVGRIDTPYEHFGNAKGFTDWLTRHDRYSTWDAKAIVAFLDTHDSAAFGTSRKLWLRRLAGRFWVVRPPARFLLMYVLRAGFLGGWSALLFCTRYAIYEYMTLEKIVELRRRATGLPL